MRVLFSTTAGSGHFGPLVPFAQACKQAGHDVVVAAPASFAGPMTAAGFDHAPFADVAPEIIGPIFGRLPDLSFEEANKTVMVEVFGRLDAQAALPGLTDVIKEWRPDVVVREPCEFASLVAAERAGVAQVQVAIGIDGLMGFALPTLAAPLAELSVIAGLPVDQALETLSTTEGFTCVPAVLDSAGTTEPTDASACGGGRVWRFRDGSLGAAAGTLPPSWGKQDDPLVYVTFGSVTAGLGPFAMMYRATLDALANMSVRVLMTTGTDGDPTSLEPLPVNAHVERWWPQADVILHAAVVIGHGGFGTTMIALAAGVPQIVVPLFAFDQRINAERVAAVRAGIHLRDGPASTAAIPAALTRVLTDPSYRDGAMAIAADIADLPDMAASVPILEELAAT